MIARAGQVVPEFQVPPSFPLNQFCRLLRVSRDFQGSLDFPVFRGCLGSLGYREHIRKCHKDSKMKIKSVFSFTVALIMSKAFRFFYFFHILQYMAAATRCTPKLEKTCFVRLILADIDRCCNLLHCNNNNNVNNDNKLYSLSA